MACLRSYWLAPASLLSFSPEQSVVPPPGTVGGKPVRHGVDQALATHLPCLDPDLRREVAIVLDLSLPLAERARELTRRPGNLLSRAASAAGAQQLYQHLEIDKLESRQQALVGLAAAVEKAPLPSKTHAALQVPLRVMRGGGDWHAGAGAVLRLLAISGLEHLKARYDNSAVQALDAIRTAAEAVTSADLQVVHLLWRMFAATRDELANRCPELAAALEVALELAGRPEGSPPLPAGRPGAAGTPKWVLHSIQSFAKAWIAHWVSGHPQGPRAAFRAPNSLRGGAIYPYLRAECGLELVLVAIPWCPYCRTELSSGRRCRCSAQNQARNADPNDYYVVRRWLVLRDRISSSVCLRPHGWKGWVRSSSAQAGGVQGGSKGGLTAYLLREPGSSQPVEDYADGLSDVFDEVSERIRRDHVRDLFRRLIRACVDSAGAEGAGPLLVFLFAAYSKPEDLLEDMEPVEEPAELADVISDDRLDRAWAVLTGRTGETSRAESLPWQKLKEVWQRVPDAAAEGQAKDPLAALCVRQSVTKWRPQALRSAKHRLIKNLLAACCLEEPPSLNGGP
ncbi:MAG: hypothetical protein H5T86_07735 [Armatimonadetes bacterium]|nr:hypothetical protein [Armatimonadota bacterium]